MTSPILFKILVKSFSNFCFFCSQLIPYLVFLVGLTVSDYIFKNALSINGKLKPIPILFIVIKRVRKSLHLIKE